MNIITQKSCERYSQLYKEAVTLSDALFAVERQAREVSVADGLELRQKQAVSILASLTSNCRRNEMDPHSSFI
jgi:hypothetical protein